MATKPKFTPLSKLLKPSAELAAITGDQPISRPRVMQAVWAYIKTHDLQDPQHKRTIVPDQVLAKVLGTERISMFDMPGRLSGHLSPA